MTHSSNSVTAEERYILSLLNTTPTQQPLQADLVFTLILNLQRGIDDEDDFYIAGYEASASGSLPPPEGISEHFKAGYRDGGGCRNRAFRRRNQALSRGREHR